MNDYCLIRHTFERRLHGLFSRAWMDEMPGGLVRWSVISLLGASRAIASRLAFNRRRHSGAVGEAAMLFFGGATMRC